MNTFDNNVAILSYAVLSEKFNDGESVVLSFVPLVEDLLLSIDESVVAKSRLVELYEHRYGYPMPPAVLNEILSSLSKNGKIDFLKDEYIDIVKSKIEGVSYEYSVALNKLKSSFSYFAKQNGEEIKPSDVVQIFLGFMSKYAVDLNSFFNFLSEENEINLENDNEYNKIIVDYLMKARTEDQKLFELLNDIFFGIALSSVLKLDQIKIQELEENNIFEGFLVDSNYVFRLLDLQTTYEHTATLHTHKMVQNTGAKFFILAETLEQISQTLNKFIDAVNPHTKRCLEPYGEESFSGIHSAYIRRNLTKAKLLEIITDLQEVLDKNYGIKLWEKDVATVSEEDDITISSMNKFKPNADYDNLSHDLILVKTIDTARPTYISDSSKALFWVLTDDNKLMKWSSSKYNNKRVPECITESQLSTILWLRSPKQFSGQALENVVFALRNQSLINKDQYKRISEAIEKQKERFAGNEAKLNMMSLLFHTSCISLPEIEDAAESDEQLDHLFDEKMEKAKQVIENIKSDKKAIEDENELIRQKLKEVVDLEQESRSVISEGQNKLISAIEDSIADLESFLNDKKTQKQRCESQKEKELKKIKKRLNTIIAFVVIIFCAIFVFINKKTEAFDKHGDLISIIISFLGAAFFVVFGTDILSFINQKKTDKAQKILVKRQKRLKCDNYDEKLNQLHEEIKDLENKLEEKNNQLIEILEKSSS